MATNRAANIQVATGFSQMICEAQPQTRVGDSVSGSESFVVVRGINVAITRTACHIGGTRAWFVCPSCGRRCAILYPVQCRQCLGLHYASEHESKLDRLLRKAIHHRQMFGQTERGIGCPFPRKPYRMRWHTYLQARQKARDMENKIAQVFTKRMGLRL